MKMSLHSRLSQKLFKQYVTVYSRIFVILALAVLSGSLFIIQKNTSRNVRTSMSAILDTLTALPRILCIRNPFLFHRMSFCGRIWRFF